MWLRVGISSVVRRSLVGICAGVVVAWSSVGFAQFDLDVEQTLLIDLLRDGKYKQALAETRRVEKLVRPPKKNPIPGPGTKIYIDLLIYQGTLERRMGSLDAAEKSLGEAFKLINDPVYQQFLARITPEDEKARGTHHLLTELAYLQLLDSATEVFLDRIRAANQQRLLRPVLPATGAPSATPVDNATPTQGEASAAPADDRDQIVGWFRRVDDLIRWSQGVRGSLRGRFAEADKKNLPPAEARLALSPQARTVASLAPPYRFVGMRYLEASKLPWTLSFDAETPPEDAARRPGAAAEPTDEPAEERQSQAASQRLRAKAYLERSIAFADDVMAPVLALMAADEANDDRKEDKIDPEIRLAAHQEAARIRAERLVPLAEVALLGDALPAARAAIDGALGALREAERPHHPDLARPLIVSAEVAFAASRRSLEEQDAATARDQAQLAVESLQDARLLLESKDSAFDRAAPIHALLASQLAVAESFAKSSTQSAAASSAADAAARRALAAIKAAPKPKPVAPAPAQPPAAVPPAAGPKPNQPPGQPKVPVVQPRS